MFCNHCGTEIGDHVKFCTACGAPVNQVPAQENPAAENTPPADLYEAAPKPETPAAPQPEQYQTPTAYNATVYRAPIDPGRAKLSRAIAALLAALTIITMLLGWFTVKVSTEEMDLPASVNLDNISSSVSVFGVAKTMGQFHSIADKAWNAMKKETSKFIDEDDLRGVKKTIRAIGTASFMLRLVQILVLLSVVSFLAFLFMMIGGYRHGAMMGQLGSCLAVLAAILFAVLMLTANLSLSSVIESMGGDPEGILEVLKFGSSIWVYLTILMGIVSMAFITIRKDLLKGIR